METSFQLVAEYDKRVKAGEFPLEEGQKRAAQRLKSMTYDKGGYLWINDMQPKVIMHPTQPQLDGKDVSDYKDPNGNALFVEFVKVCKRKRRRFRQYMWPKPGATVPAPRSLT